MKIGIVTVHDSSNYGSFLQAYALQKTLQKLGHEVYFIRTREKSYITKIFFNNIKPLFPNPVKMFQMFKEDVVKYHAFKKEWKVFKTIDSAKDEKLDRIILGSDEIWNVTSKVFRRPVFYGIGMRNVLTYGISVSKANKNDFDAYPDLKDAIKKIGKVLVRDINTKQVIDDITGNDSPMVADPTFLCDVSEFESKQQSYKPINKRYILVYSYVFNDNMKNNIIRFAKENDLLIVSACIRHNWTDVYINGSPLSFCGLLRNADYVVTTTFHGTVFSFLNHKKFVAEPFTPKVIDVLDKVSLDNALIEPGADYDTFKRKLQSGFDYDAVDKKILEWREHSLKELEAQLNQSEE